MNQPVWANADESVDDGRKGCSYVVIYENDQLLTDRNYTFGALLAHSCNSEKDRPWFSSLRNWNKKVLEKAKHGLGIPDDVTGRSYAHYGGISLYTPNSLKVRRPGKAYGRPYASLLIYGDSVLHANGAVSIKQEVQIGVMGHPIGGVIQETVHEVLALDDPQGWSTEISRGGEPVLGYSIRGKQRLCADSGEFGFCGNGNFDLTATLGGSLGYYTNLRVGLSGRFGSISSPFWVDHGSISNRTLQPSLIPDSGDELYFVATAGAEIVAYSAILQGQFRRSEYVIAGSDVKRAVPYASFGMAMSCGEFRFSMSHNIKGPEIKGGKMHRWTSISIGRLF